MFNTFFQAGRKIFQRGLFPYAPLVTDLGLGVLYY